MEDSGKGIGSEKLSIDKKRSDNVRVMFPELNSVYGSKNNGGSSDVSINLPETPTLVNVNPVLAAEVSNKSSGKDKNVVEGYVAGDNSG